MSVDRGSVARSYAELLKLIEITGPFISLPVYKEVFPQGFVKDDAVQTASLREAYNEWSEARQSVREMVSPRQRQWIQAVLEQVLEWPGDRLAEHNAIAQNLSAAVPQHGETLRPDMVLTDGAIPRLFVQIIPPAQEPSQRPAKTSWNASYISRLSELLTATGVPLGLLTNGEQWTLVYAERQQPTGTATWRAEFWFEERLTMRAFRDLLGIQSFFGRPEKETLASLYRRSLENQQEVSATLGRQVRRAVELLVSAMDRENRELHGALLNGVDEEHIYEAALSLMMRLVFLLFAEERELLPVANPVYLDHYAVSTIYAQLREAADSHGEEVLERRYDAFARLLATFRAVHAGVNHDLLTLPAYGGHLFDPDRFPFLERRAHGISWQEAAAQPLPINNRTVLHLLEALQFLEMKVPGSGIERRRVSFRALDIEQIGHVYEGLLDHTAKRATEPVLGLAGSEEREIALAEIERRKAQPSFFEWLKDETGRSVKAIETALKQNNVLHAERWPLWERVAPFAGLIRLDDNGDPCIFPEGSVYVTAGTARRQSGTQYTPRSLTREVVHYALEPVCYAGPAEGTISEEWQLKSAGQLLDLKICDPACGSGAFLAEACRYLADRLVEAWDSAEKALGPGVKITPYGYASLGFPEEMLLPTDDAERSLIARRLIAQRCLYGVDKNPLAVEMAKLSLWLLTLERNKPFTFLDHAVRCGDSLLGVNMQQLKHYNLSGQGKEATHLLFVNDDLLWASEMRDGLSKMQYQPEDQERRLKAALERTRRVRASADLLIATAFEENSDQLAQQVAMRLEQQEQAARAVLSGKRPFHWPVEFPEVFINADGFDALIGNPPFLGGFRISGFLGDDYLRYLLSTNPLTSGNGDLVSFFVRQSSSHAKVNGILGFVTTNSISQGASRENSLDFLVENGFTIFRAVKTAVWPGTANVFISIIHLRRGAWCGSFSLDRKTVTSISPYLDAGNAIFSPLRLAENRNVIFRGSTISGEGFILDRSKRDALILVDPKSADVIKPFLTGQDINQCSTQSSDRFAIDFGSAGEAECQAFVACWDHLHMTVREQRKGNKILTREKLWWQYIGRQEALYERIRGLSRVLACGQVSKYWSVSWISTAQVFADKVVVFLLTSDADFAVLNSVFHLEWAEKTSSRLKDDPNYNLAKTFETFPRPRLVEELHDLGRDYDAARRGIMLNRGEGLTAVYNRFHSSCERSDDIASLRELQTRIDNATAVSYGWSDLDLRRTFKSTKEVERFCISDEARSQLLSRLLKLNIERGTSRGNARTPAKRPQTEKQRLPPSLF